MMIEVGLGATGSRSFALPVRAEVATGGDEDAAATGIADAAAVASLGFTARPQRAAWQVVILSSSALRS